jgi:perosamine synthetase
LRAKRFSRQGLIRNSEDFIIKGEGQWHQEVHEFGLNYRLPDVLCALGLSQLERISSFKSKRKFLFSRYANLLGNLDSVQLPTQRSYVDPTWHLYPIQVKATDRRYIFDSLRSDGIGVQVNYIPANRHPVFSKDSRQTPALIVAENFYSREISLPIHVNLSEAEQEYISETLIKICDSLED